MEGVSIKSQENSLVFIKAKGESNWFDPLELFF
jgi:hypothetical protein